MSVSSRASTTQRGDAQGNSLSLQPFDQMSSTGLCWVSVPLRINQMDDCRGDWRAAVAGGSSPGKRAAAEGRINTAALSFPAHTYTPSLHTVLGLQYLTFHKECCFLPDPLNAIYLLFDLEHNFTMSRTSILFADCSVSC